MNELQALLLGIIQGLTEFLPVSSSGHLEIGHAFLGIENVDNLVFAMVLHGATALSTIVVFRDDIWALLKGLFRFKWDDQTKYLAKIVLSSIPVIIVGLFFKDTVEALFSGRLIFVGSMLLVTALLLFLSGFSRKGGKKISYINAIIIGIAQAIAVIPGISRSGATIATGLLLGTKKEGLARFSFLIVLIPILGAFGYNILNGEFSSESKIGLIPLLAGFFAAFATGLVACKWMIGIVKKGKLIYFAIYCFIIGLIAIFAA